MPRTVNDIVNQLPPLPATPLPAPAYTPLNHPQKKVGLSVASMANHMSDEGWQLFEGLSLAGYSLFGNKAHNSIAASHIDVHDTDVKNIVEEFDIGTLVLQDRREWDISANCLANLSEYYHNTDLLKNISTIFKVTVLKDAHANPPYQRFAADSIGCHAWITYYHPAIVQAVAPYVRSQHLIRTYHSIDPSSVPRFDPYGHDGCLLSGYMDRRYYPLRCAIAEIAHALPGTIIKPHPGYHNTGTNTNDYLNLLSQFKVAICTSSIYGYSLRKIIEATACGCRVITDLPSDDVLPEIDANLVRIDLEPRDTLHERLAELLYELYGSYDPEIQRHFSIAAKQYYSVTASGIRLAEDIKKMRSTYTNVPLPLSSAHPVRIHGPR